MRAEKLTLQLVHINVGGGFGFVDRSTLASQKPGTWPRRGKLGVIDVAMRQT